MHELCVQTQEQIVGEGETETIFLVFKNVVITQLLSEGKDKELDCKMKSLLLAAEISSTIVKTFRKHVTTLCISVLTTISHYDK